MLGVSHGTVYRHFKTKAALHQAITTRWLESITLPLAEIAGDNADAKQRLQQWFKTLMEIKQRNFVDDPEMFESYLELAKSTPEQVKSKHINSLLAQVESILNAGNAAGSFAIEDCSLMAKTLFFATGRYHHPLHAKEWSDPHIQRDFEHLMALLIRGIESRA